MAMVYSSSTPTLARWMTTRRKKTMTTGRRKKVANRSGWSNPEATELGTARSGGDDRDGWILSDLGKKGYRITAG